MSKEQIKGEINEVLDNLPQDALERLLHVLKGLRSSTKSMFSADQVEKVLREDHQLLRKLAK